MMVGALGAITHLIRLDRIEARSDKHFDFRQKCEPVGAKTSPRRSNIPVKQFTETIGTLDRYLALLAHHATDPAGRDRVR
jgi:hypothetical protein